MAKIFYKSGTMRVFCCLAILAALLVAGCGEDESTGKAGNDDAAETRPAKAAPEPNPDAELAEEEGLELLEITIDGWPNADYGGLYLGNERGYFADVGLKLHLHTPIEPRRPVLYVAGKTVPLGVSHQPEVTLARERGTPIVAVGSLQPHPTAALIWLKRSGIRGIADLKGKTIATEGLESQERLLQAILARANLSLDDIDIIRPKYLMIPSLKGGRADAAIGGSWNIEGIQLRQEGFEPVVKPVRTLGVPDYEELVLIAREDEAPGLKGQIHRFFEALSRGNKAALADPAAAVKALKVAYPELNVRAAAKGVKVTTPMLSRTHRMDSARWQSFTKWMLDNELLEEDQPASEALTNAYVP
jgi:putative hydroxymethylpyrimidine transport system substrate-binding protein